MVKIQSSKNGVLFVTLPKQVVQLMQLQKGYEVAILPDVHGTQAVIRIMSREIKE